MNVRSEGWPVWSDPMDELRLAKLLKKLMLVPLERSMPRQVILLHNAIADRHILKVGIYLTLARVHTAPSSILIFDLIVYHQCCIKEQ